MKRRYHSIDVLLEERRVHLDALANPRRQRWVVKAYVFDGSAWEALDPCMYVRDRPPPTLSLAGIGKLDGRACRDCEEWSGTPFVVLYFAGSGAVVPVVPEESALRRLMLSERDTAHDDDGHALFGGGRS